jgi:hypothetical protein
MTTQSLPRILAIRCRAVFAALLAGVATFAGMTAEAADHRLRDIRFDFGSILFSMPEVVVQGTDLTQQELADILRADGATPIHERLARLQARTILFPKLEIGQKFGKFSGLTTHVDVRFNDVANGRAATGSIASARTSGKMPDGKAFSAEQGAMQFEGLDLRALADAMTQTRPADSRPTPQTVIANMRTESSRSTQDGQSETRTGVQIARAIALSRGTTAQSVRWNDLMLLMEALLVLDADGKTPELPQEFRDPDRIIRLIGIIDDVSLAESSVSDMQISSKARGKDQPAMNLAIKRFSLEMPGLGQASRFQMDDLSGTVEQVKLSLKSLGVSGFTPPEGYEAMAKKARPIIEGGRFGELWAIAPTLGSFKFGGLAVDVPQKDKGTAAPEFMPFQKIALDGFEFTTRAQRNGLPTDMLLAMSGLTIPIDARTEGLKELAAMGFKEATFSSAFDIGWNPQTREIALRRFEAAMKDGFAKSLSGTLAQATEELFSLDGNIRQMAMIGLTLKALELKFQNDGLLDRFAKLTADQQKKSPDAIWREWGTMAALVIPAMLGDSEQAKAISSAVSRFLARPRNLAITATAKPRDGVGLADFMAAGGDAKALLPKFDLKAAAE